MAGSADEGALVIVIRRDSRGILFSFAEWIDARPAYFLHPDLSGLYRDGRMTPLLRRRLGPSDRISPFTEVQAAPRAGSLRQRASDDS